jgi:hypothetical protein
MEILKPVEVAVDVAKFIGERIIGGAWAVLADQLKEK